MKLHATYTFALMLAFGASLPACPGSPKAPGAEPAIAIPNLAARAFAYEQSDDTKTTLAQYEKALDIAIANPDAALSLPSVLGSVDALAYGSSNELRALDLPGSLAERSAHGEVAAVLHKAAQQAKGYMRPILVRAELALALRTGDAKRAAALREQTGCVQHARVSAPWSPQVASFLRDAEKGPLAVDFPATATSPALPAAPADGHGCRLSLMNASARPGVRTLAFVASIKDETRVHVLLRSDSPARLRIGTEAVLVRPYQAGESETLSLATFDAPAGDLSLWLDVASSDTDATIELTLVDDQGRPIATGTDATQAGTSTAAMVKSAKLYQAPEPTTSESRVVLANYALSIGDNALAEALTEASETPLLTLLHARALAKSSTLPEVERNERIAKDALSLSEHLAGDPRTLLWNARAIAARKSEAEAPLAALAALTVKPASKGNVPAAREGNQALASAQIDLAAAVFAARANVDDIAVQKLEAARKAFGGTPVFREADAAVQNRSVMAYVQFACVQDASRDFADNHCREALARAGKRAESKTELTRLRTLLGSPKHDSIGELREALADGDTASAKRIFDTMGPGERTLAARFATTDASPALKATLRAMLATAEGNINSLPPLLRALGDDPFAPFEGKAEALWERDRKSAIMPAAPTAVLAHEERYEVDASGLVRFVLFDVRRVSGTTDVEQNAQAVPPMLTGPDTLRTLRRRILKRDGRIVTPERAPGAAQAHADLAQLEAGDIVESAFEGFAMPSDHGLFGFDSPDLLPQRTAVYDASITIVVDAHLSLVPFAHALLGSPVVGTEGSGKSYKYSLREASVRRAEDGTPRADRAVAVSLQSGDYPTIARAVRDRFASLADDGRDVRKFADAAVMTLGTGDHPVRAKIEALTLASSEAIKQASGTLLSDWNTDDASPAGDSARAMLARREGSRTWLLHRALDALHIDNEILLAEREAYTSKANYPPHTGRFVHPLLSVHLAPNEPALLIDADVPGPALPAGRISPELSGLKTLAPATGTIGTLPASRDQDSRDEVDLRVIVSSDGNAKGQLTVLLRGRASQELAEAMVRVVGAERDRALRGVVLGWVPRATVDDVQLSSSEGSWQVALRANVTIGAFAGKRQRDKTTIEYRLPGLDPFHAVYPRPYVGTLSSLLATQEGRTGDLSVDRTQHYHLRRQVELPVGATFERMPAALAINSGLASAKRTIEVDGRVLVENFDLSLNHGTVAQADYEAFAGKLRAIDEGLLTGISVTMPIAKP